MTRLKVGNIQHPDGTVDNISLTDTGLVGIGTASPSANLELGTVGGSDQTLRLNSGGNGYLELSAEGSLNKLISGNAATGSASLSFEVSSGGTESEAARIDSSGRLLVGTSSAYANFNYGGADQSARFQVSGAGVDEGSMALVRTNAYPIFYLAGGGSGVNVNNNSVLGAHVFSGYHTSKYYTGADIRCEVDGTPGADDMPGRLVFSTTSDGANSPTERMRIANDGSIYIADTSSYSGFGGGASGGVRWRGTTQTAQCQMEGYATGTSTSRHILFSNPNGVVGSITTASSATAYNTSSDYRLKENIAPVTDGITRLQQLKPSRFNFIVDPDTVVDGFIAHEAAEVVPECVTGTKDEIDEDGNPVYQGIDQSKLVPLLTAALQEAIGRIETLEAEVAALKGA